MRKLLRAVLPLSRGALALWAWKNRWELARWAGFARSSPSRLREGRRSDVVLEARVRAALAGDRRTRGARDVRVDDVRGGVVTLSGQPSSPHRAASEEVAAGVKGVAEVRFETAPTTGPPAAGATM